MPGEIGNLGQAESCGDENLTRLNVDISGQALNPKCSFEPIKMGGYAGAHARQVCKGGHSTRILVSVGA